MSKLAIALSLSLVAFLIACTSPALDPPLDSGLDSAGADAPSPVDASPDLVLNCALYLNDPAAVHEPACVSIPTGVQPSNGWPVVEAFHYYSSNYTTALNRAGLGPVADWAIVIAPNGVTGPKGRLWNGAPDCCDDYQAILNPDDVAYAINLLHELEAEPGIAVDTTQIETVGESAGGTMAEAVLCASSEFAAGVDFDGVAVAPLPCGRPITLRKIHGTTDGTLHFGGGIFAGSMPPYPATDDATPYGCATFDPTGVTQDYDPGVAGAESHQYLANGCAPGTNVEMWEDVFGKHLPGTTAAWTNQTLAWMKAQHL